MTESPATNATEPPASVPAPFGWASFWRLGVRGAQRLARAPVLGLLLLYRGLSAVTPGTCRFTPTCSDYARVAIARHGVLRGGWLALQRVGRCHPLCDWGYDPVPETPHAGNRTHDTQDKQEETA